MKSAMFELTIGLAEDVVHCLLDCDIISMYPGKKSHDCHIPLSIASASLSGISMLNSCTSVRAVPRLYYLMRLTSSIAMTTSTASRLSRPRSLWK